MNSITRTVLASALLGVGLISALPASAAITPVTVKQAVDMTRRSVTLKNVVTGANQSITMWTFSNASSSRTSGGNDGSVDNNAPFPGPVLVFREQDTVEYTFNDKCPCENRPSAHPYAGHTIHLHGLDVTTREDGVAETSFSVLPWTSYTYKMATRSAGSFVYHCHIHTVLHQQMGMYGGIIVTPADSLDQNKSFTGSPDTFVKQYYWITAEVDKTWHDKASNRDYGDSAEFSYFSQYNPQHFVLANYPIDTATLGVGTATPGRGQINPSTAGVSFTKATKNLIRVGNLGYLNHRLTITNSSGALMPFDIIATDGKPMRDVNKNLAPMTGQTKVEYAAGERYDLLVSFPTAGTYTAKIEFLDPATKALTASGKGVLTQAITVQ